MQGPLRKVLQAVLYEVGAIAFISPVMAMVFGKSLFASGALALMLSGVALAWNMLFSLLFERWEARQHNRRRGFLRRLLHAAGFEGGLVVLLVPLMAWWLGISLLDAFIADLGLLVFFFFYAFVFQWSFDKAFGLPDSARVAAT
ncbi:PACE efflux transporter [Pseudomonas sp. LRF_L74]|uniref:PACE efflux transporter n=1 Tax=Pseudomonas sp. LRF_L74 TaxID=3369422 RepID=UPI003F63078D